MGVSSVLSLLGGVALFLFGMSLMGDGLKKVAGSRLELVLYKLSGTPLRGLLLGTGVTAVIQSSSATSVMVVGFVNSGMMKLKQAISVILGSMIGTSITGWVICLSSLENTGGWVSLLSTSTLAALVAVAGIILRLFSKQQSRRHVGDIMLGFSVLMYGMQAMSGAVAPLKDSPAFISLLTMFENPVIGILVGAGFTAVLQSASAGVGILQALSMTGAITFKAAYPLILGISIGASVPVLLSAIGAKVDGRRASFAYLVNSVIGAIIGVVAYYGLDLAFDFTFKYDTMNQFSIAFVNTVFRLITSAAMLPFLDGFMRLVSSIIKESAGEKAANAEFDKLDERFLKHPALAVEQSRLTVNSMAALSKETVQKSIHLLYDYSPAGAAEIERNEDMVDRYEDKIGTYLVKLNGHELTREQNENVSKYLHVLSDLERISDHAMNISELAREIHEKKIVFSEAGSHELAVLEGAVNEILELAVGCFVDCDTDKAYMVEPLEEQIDVLCDQMKLNHIERVQRGMCSLNLGFVFNDLLTNFERVADHCSNLAIAHIELQDDEYDTHGYVVDLKATRSHNFDALYQGYAEKYKI